MLNLKIYTKVFELNGKLHNKNVLAICAPLLFFLIAWLSTSAALVWKDVDVWTCYTVEFSWMFFVLGYGLVTWARVQDYWTAITELERLRAWNIGCLGVDRMFNYFYKTNSQQKVLALAIGTLSVPSDYYYVKGAFLSKDRRALRPWNSDWWVALVNPVDLNPSR